MEFPQPLTIEKKQGDRTSLFLTLLAFAAGALVSLHGQRFFPDESRYFIGQMFLIAASHPEAHPGEFIRALMPEAMLSPVYHLLYFPAAALQYFLASGDYQSDISGWITVPSWIIVPSLWGACWFALNSRLLYEIISKAGGTTLSALLTQALYLLWVPHYFYIRHLFPCMLAESLLILSVYFLLPLFQDMQSLENRKRRKHLLIAGLLWFLGFHTYLGSYATLPLILLGLFLSARKTNGFKESLQCLGWFLLPEVVLLVFFEGLFQGVAGHSYISSLLQHATSITQGDFSEGWQVPFRYAWFISPTATLLFLTGFGWGLRVVFKQRLFQRHFNVRLDDQRLLLLALISSALLLLYGWLAVSSSLFHRFVVYGRLLLPVWLLCVAQGGLILSLLLENSRHRMRQLGVVTALLIITGCLGSFKTFLTLQYPLDVNRMLEEKTGIVLDGKFLHSSRQPDYALDIRRPTTDTTVLIGRTVSTQAGPLALFTCEAIRPLLDKNKTVYLVLNREYILPVHHQNPIVDQDIYNGNVLYDAPHPQRYPPYQYEGLTLSERRTLDNAQMGEGIGLRMQVIKNPCPSSL